MPAPKGNDFAVGNSGGGAPEGNQNAVGNDGGAPPKNQNAQTVGLWSKHEYYYQDLSADEKEWVDQFLRDLLTQYADVHGEEPSPMDEELLKNIAIDVHRVAHANSWFAKEELIHKQKRHGDGWTSVETKIIVWMSEIRRYNESIYRRLDKQDLLKSPDEQATDAMEDMASSSYTITVDSEGEDEDSQQA